MSQRSIPLFVFQDLLDSVDLRSVWNAQGHNSWFLSGGHPLALKIEFPSSCDSLGRASRGPDFADVVGDGFTLVHRWKLTCKHSRLVNPNQHPGGFRLCSGGSAQPKCREKKESREPLNHQSVVATQR